MLDIYIKVFIVGDINVYCPTKPLEKDVFKPALCFRPFAVCHQTHFKLTYFDLTWAGPVKLPFLLV